MTTIGALLRERAAAHPDRPLVTCGPDTRTCGEMDERADRVASGLASIGVRTGDRVAIVLPNRIEMLDLFFACARLGAVQVPLNVFLRGEFLRYQLDDCDPVLVITDGAGASAIEGRRVLNLDTDGLPVSASAPPGGPDADAALLSILYTSGTTGMPKGCMLPHAWYLSSAARPSEEMFGYRPDDVLYAALPLYHGWARGMVASALLHGLHAVVDPAFSATTILGRLKQTRTTILKGVGMMGMAMLALPPSDADRDHDVRCTLMFPLSPDDQTRFHDRFGIEVLAQMYGQTETGAISYASVGAERNLASVGRPSPLFDVAVLDENDDPVPDGVTGEIVVRPRTRGALFAGYWRKPDETLDAWRGLWHHTGDLGRLDGGYLFFVDRKKDALRRRGENVSSVQLEAALCAHPKIAEAAVHAVPSEMTEDEIKACLVLAPDASTTPEEMFGFFREALPYFAIPRYVEIVPELPRNATMRVMKHLLRERGVTPDTWDLESLGLTLERAERR